jgi:hypothetical protein
VTRLSVFAEIEEAVAAIAAGEMVVVIDDADRENEGDLIVAAADGLAQVELADPIQQVHEAMWQPEYPPVEPA